MLRDGSYSDAYPAFRAYRARALTTNLSSPRPPSGRMNCSRTLSLEGVLRTFGESPLMGGRDVATTS